MARRIDRYDDSHEIAQQTLVMSSDQSVVYAEPQYRDYLLIATSSTRSIRGLLRAHQAFITEGKDHAGMLIGQQQRYKVGEELKRILRFIGSVSA
jgi:hypothetical protein